MTAALHPVTDRTREALAQSLRGCDELLVEAEWLAKLARSEATGVPLRIKLGLDPTAPDLHLGHTVVLNKMRQLQDLGHTVIFLIGDFTGDDRRSVGPQQHAPAAHARADRGERPDLLQPGRLVLDREKTEIRYNAEWSDPLGARGMIQLASRYTVARMMERDDFTKRFKGGVPISVHEFLYPLMQGYDSVALKSDIELGGTDQKFNLLVGRELQQRIWPGTAVHPDHAAARGPGRRRQDVEVEEQLHRHHRAAQRDVRQADVDLRHADVEVLHAAVVPADGRDRAPAAPNARAAAIPTRREGDARPGDRRRASIRAPRPSRRWRTSRRGSGRAAIPDDIDEVALAGAPWASRRSSSRRAWRPPPARPTATWSRAACGWMAPGSRTRP
jgi:hypothetical protein